MSGGFFRGTTADQDTRFSNKQAKLMKSHKFPPELDHIVDMSKVKMDVVRPWIAKRVTELLGFEDEVLINFIYGLLEGKNVNGKEIQISITGFMEKNTGKFMRELWTLLLSAQKNASGVPQQFLDEKEEETKKIMAESERITNEIQRKKEREAEEFGFDQKKMEGGFDTSRHNTTSDKPLSNRRNGREHSHSPDERNEIVGRNGRDRKTRLSISPHSIGSSLSPRRSSSRSPRARKRSISTERERPNQRRSISPYRSRLSRRSPSLSRRRSSYRRRSRSRSRSQSLSPQRFRSHRNTSPHTRRRRSPSPVRRRSPARRYRRSPTPVRRRSPPRRSPSPVRRRSPARRSPSPVRRRSRPSRSRSPARRGSRGMIRHQSPSPLQDKSPLSPQRRGNTSSPSQGESPSKHTSLSPQRRRSPPPRNIPAPPIRRRTPPVAHERYNQKSPKAQRSRYRGQSPDSHKSNPSGGRKHQSPDSRSLSPDQSVYVSPFRRTTISPSREKSPTHMKKQTITSSKINHSSPEYRSVRESHKKSNFSRGDQSVDLKKEEPLKEIYKGKTRSSDSPSNRSYNDDGLRALHSSKGEETEIRKESPPLVTKENYSAKENASHEVIGKSVNGASSDSGYDDGKKRKHRGSSSKHEVTSDEDSSDVDANETKDARRKRKKEEKRLRREKRRLRHEEKRRKKEEKRSEKHKSRKDDDSTVTKKVYEKSDVEDEDEEKKKQLEIELRKKALESLKAKKGFGQ